MLVFVEKIKDPIWNSIPITQIEKDVVNSSPFKRIRDVKQMSMAYITYIGANHTRYEHSIGTMHAAYRMADAIPNIKKDFFKENYDIAIQCLRLAALLHDVGHPPFSHAVEWTFKKNPELSPFHGYSHDSYTKKIIEENKEIDKIIGKYVSWINKGHYYGGRPLKIGKKNFRKAIATLATGNIEGLLSQNVKFLQDLTILAPILNGDLDADKIDYILRDNYHCGFPTGVDFNEVVEAFDLFQGSIDSSNTKLLLKKQYISTVETLLHSRLKLMDLIHHETKNRIANQMLMRTVAKIIKNKDKNKLKDVVRRMHEEWTDHEMFSFILNESEGDSWTKRLLRGQTLLYNVRLNLPTLPSITRRYLYLMSKKPEYLLELQDKLEEQIGEKLHLDLCFIDPPPLTLQLLGNSNSHKAYLYDASNIIKGILWESFYRSFVAIYSDSKKIKKEKKGDLKIRDTLIHSTNEIGKKIINKICEEQKITCGELVVCVLASIKKFSNENLNKMPVWVPGIYEFQKFIEHLVKRGIGYKLDDFKTIKKEYDPSFYREVMQLVFCGLISLREKELTGYSTNYYLRRYDYKIRSFGMSYYKECLSELYKKITETVFQSQMEVKEFIENSIKYSLKVDKTDDEKYKRYVKKVKIDKECIVNRGGCPLVL